MNLGEFCYENFGDGDYWQNNTIWFSYLNGDGDRLALVDGAVFERDGVTRIGGGISLANDYNFYTNRYNTILIGGNLLTEGELQMG